MPAFEEDSIRRFEIVLEALVFRARAHGITASREHLARRLFDVVRAGFKDTDDLIERVLKRPDDDGDDPFRPPFGMRPPPSSAPIWALPRAAA